MGLEDLIEKARAEREELEGKLRGFAIRDAGFDSGPWAKAIVKTYDGPADPEAVRAFAAQEYGLGVATEEADQQEDDQ